MIIDRSLREVPDTGRADEGTNAVVSASRHVAPRGRTLIVAATVAATMLGTTGAAHGATARRVAEHPTTPQRVAIATTPSPTPADCAELIDLPPSAVIGCARAAVHAATSLRMIVAAGGARVDEAIDADSASQVLHAGRVLIAVRRTGDSIYVFQNAAFLRRILPRSIAQRVVSAVHGRWVSYHRGTAAYRFQASLTSLRSAETELLDVPAHLQAIPGVTVGGRPTVGVTGVSHGSRLYVAARGDALPLLELAPAGIAGRARLLWNRPVAVTAPPARNVMSARAFDRILVRALRSLPRHANAVSEVGSGGPMLNRFLRRLS